jgi:hypothetical protein
MIRFATWAARGLELRWSVVVGNHDYEESASAGLMVEPAMRRP